jgi:hypothetical protein
LFVVTLELNATRAMLKTSSGKMSDDTHAIGEAFQRKRLFRQGASRERAVRDRSRRYAVSGIAPTISRFDAGGTLGSLQRFDRNRGAFVANLAVATAEDSGSFRRRTNFSRDDPFRFLPIPAAGDSEIPSHGVNGFRRMSSGDYRNLTPNELSSKPR